MRDRSDFTTGVVAASLGMVGWAASGVIVKGIDLPALAVVFWRMTIYAVVIVTVLRLKGRPLTMRGLRISTPGGIALGLDIMLFFSAVKLTTVANATVIGAMQPVLMLAISGPLFGERPRRSDWMLAIVALGGVGLVLFGSAGVPEWSPVGDFLALLTLFAWTFYFVFSKKTAIASTPSSTRPAPRWWPQRWPPRWRCCRVRWLRCPTAPRGSGWWYWPWAPASPPTSWSTGRSTRSPCGWGPRLTLAIPVASVLLAWVFLGEQLVLAQVVGILIVTGALTGLVVKPAPPPVRQPVPDGQEQMFGPS